MSWYQTFLPDNKWQDEGEWLQAIPGEVSLDIRDIFSSEIVVKHLPSLTREVEKSPSLELLKKCGYGTGEQFIGGHGAGLMTGLDLRGLSQP